MAVYMGGDKKPSVGLGVIVRKDGKVLLGKRKCSYGEGTWHFPGGHLEFNEDFEACAERETMEETGISIKNIKFLTATNDIIKEDARHYITIFMVADHDSGEPKIMEPDKSEEWMWFSWDKLPTPLFIPTKSFVKQNINPFKL